VDHFSIFLKHVDVGPLGCDAMWTVGRHQSLEEHAASIFSSDYFSNLIKTSMLVL
jgi:hypothetical protein